MIVGLEKLIHYVMYFCIVIQWFIIIPFCVKAVNAAFEEVIVIDKFEPAQFKNKKKWYVRLLLLVSLMPLINFVLLFSLFLIAVTESFRVFAISKFKLFMMEFKKLW